MTYEKLKERRLLMEDNKLIIYKNSEGNIIVDAIYKDETLWLSQKGMSKVFNVGVPAISKHLKNIFAENELDKNSVVSKMETTEFLSTSPSLQQPLKATSEGLILFSNLLGNQLLLILRW